MGVYEVIDCNTAGAIPVTNCDARVEPGQTAVLSNIVPLVPGQYYYLCIDGRNNDVCDWDISVTNGSTMVPPVTQGGGITGPSTICSGTPATYSTNPVPNAPNHYWYLDGAPLPGSGSNYNITFPAPGTYQVCVEASNTCSTSPQECMTVTVADIPPTVIQGVICPGQCYPYLSTQFCAAGSYPYLFTSVAGCDSLVTVVITELTSVQVTLDTSACTGETVLIGGTPYATPGSYTITLPGVNTCDTTLTLNVTENPTFQETESATICLGTSYTFGTQILTTAQICDGQSFPFGGSSFTTSGSFPVIFTSVDGCDSTVTLDLTVLPNTQSTLTEVICPGQSFPLGPNNYNTTGTYTELFTNANGCDSTVTLNLTVQPTINVTENQTICDGQTFPFDGQTLSTAGTYTGTFVSAGGCDSVVTLNLIQP